MLGLYLALLDTAYAYAEYAEAVAESRAFTRRQNNELRQSLMSLSDTKFRETYRLSKELFNDLVEELRPHIPSKLRSDGLDVETKILIALSFYATGFCQTPVGDSEYHYVSQASVSKAIREVTAALNKPEVFHRHVVFPFRRTDRETIKRRFYERTSMPGAMGCIDGTHVAIATPNNNEEHFMNKNGYHSLNVFIMCDADLNIMIVNPSYPGSTHDSYVWDNVSLKSVIERMYEEDEDVYIIGDSEYPLSNILMTPIPYTEPGSQEAYYMKLHTSAQSVVEQCIGLLKARFRCLLTNSSNKLHYAPAVAGRITNACCVLHNIANTAGIEFEPLTPEELRRERQLNQEACKRRLYAGSLTAEGRDTLASQMRAAHERRDALVQRVWRQRNTACKGPPVLQKLSPSL